MTANSMLDVARETLGLDIYPVPVKTGTKKPPMSQWQNLRLTVEELPEHFSNGVSLGWLLGIKPKPIADVDLDCAEARQVAELFEHPRTERIFGRQSSRSSHYLFELPDEFNSEKYEDPVLKKQKLKATIIELRGKGGQTVVPPSIHESGEQRRWERKGAFGVTTYAELSRWVRKTAAAALLIRYWPRGHETRFALAGTLARAGWPEKEAAEFVAAVMRIAQPDNKEAKADVRNTYEQFKQGDECFGRPKLIELLGEFGNLVVRAISKWLSLEDSSGEYILNKEGGIRPIAANAITMLKSKAEFDSVLAFNLLTMMPVKLKPAPWGDIGGAWTDYDDVKLLEYFQRHSLLMTSSNQAGEVANAVARENSFHPVRDYLDALVWDKTARLDKLLPTYVGAEDNEYTQAVGRCWMISAVARVKNPGCQADYTLLLEGAQGILKSTWLAALAGREFFLDDFAQIEDKDALLKLHGAWIIEMSEFAGVRRSDINKVKAFLTSKDDVFRAPYDRRPQHHPRMCVFAASTNDETPFTDETGNRRFWPIRCVKIDLEKTKADRDQLWAEACARYKANEKWYFEDESLNQLAAEEQRERYQTGQWDEIIIKWLVNPTQRRESYTDDKGETHYSFVIPWDSDLNEVTVDDVLLHAIGKASERWVQSDKNSVAKCLKHNNWKRVVIRDGKNTRKVYRRA